MTINELKEKYGNMSGPELDRKAIELHTSVEEGDRAFTEVLFWMRHSLNGPGVVTKLIQHVGEKQLVKAMDKIEKSTSGKHPKPLHQAVKQVISEMDKPVKKRVKSEVKVVTQPLKDSDLTALRKENEELKTRNAKLVDTVNRLKVELKEAEGRESELKEKVAWYENLLDGITRLKHGRVHVPSAKRSLYASSFD